MHTIPLYSSSGTHNRVPFRPAPPRLDRPAGALTTIHITRRLERVHARVHALQLGDPVSRGVRNAYLRRTEKGRKGGENLIFKAISSEGDARARFTHVRRGEITRKTKKLFFPNPCPVPPCARGRSGRWRQR